jgi:hypothetical protein
VAGPTTGFSGPYTPELWESCGIKDGTTLIEGEDFGTCRFSYKVSLHGGGVPKRLARFRVKADATGIISFDYRYEIYHAWFDVHARFFVSTEGVDVKQVLRVLKFHGPGSVGPKTFTGSVAMHVTRGAMFTLAIGGSNFDSDSRLEGTLTLSNFAAPVG